MITLADTERYFACHLYSGQYNCATLEQRTGALQMACLDLQGELGDLSIFPRELILAAVCEQMIYLLVNSGQFTVAKNLVSEHVEGIGSRSYSSIPAEVIAPRARQIIKSLLPKGIININRG